MDIREGKGAGKLVQLKAEVTKLKARVFIGFIGFLGFVELRRWGRGKGQQNS